MRGCISSFCYNQFLSPKQCAGPNMHVRAVLAMCILCYGMSVQLLVHSFLLLLLLWPGYHQLSASQAPWLGRPLGCWGYFSFLESPDGLLDQTCQSNISFCVTFLSCYFWADACGAPFIKVSSVYNLVLHISWIHTSLAVCLAHTIYSITRWCLFHLFCVRFSNLNQTY